MVFNNKAELRECLAAERAMYYPNGGIYLCGAFREKDILYKYIWLLRHVEFYDKQKAPIRFIYKFLLRRMMYRYSLHIPPYTCGKGLNIAHCGPIVINDGARIGNNLRIHVGASIGANKGEAPRIGNNVYIGPGAKVFGGITIADGVKIGANAVVNKECTLDGAVLVGIPAVVKGSRHDR